MDEGKKTDRRSQLKQYIFVIRQLASKELKHGNASKNLGQMWNILMPTVSMLTLGILFAFVFKRDIKNFLPYVYTGTIIFALYRGGMRGCMGSLSGNKGLILKTKIPKNLFIIEKVYVSLVRMGFSLVGYVIMLIATGTKVGPTAFLAPVGICFAIFIIIGIGKILAVVNVYFADIKYFYDIIMSRLIFYGSALFYDVDRLSPVMQKILGYNPIYLTIYFERSCILYNYVPEPMVWLKLAVFSAVLFVIGNIVFNKGSQDVVAKL